MDDVGELIRLRALLFETIGVGAAAEGWRESLAAVLADQLASEVVRILVVDGTGGLAACGIGTIEQRLPNPRLVNGRLGHVFGVVTDPRYRRRGHSRAIMTGLLGWFGEREVARVDLHASREGEPLYRALGFVDRNEPAMSWRPAV
jgi:ribosomal protein S18 acetylase RimI-like enzyme